MKIIISWEYSFSQEILVLNTGNSEITESLLNRELVFFFFLSVTHQSDSDPLEKNLCKHPPPPWKKNLRKQPSTPSEIVSFSGEPNENIVQNHSNIAFLKVS